MYVDSWAKILLVRTHHLLNFTNEMTCMYLGVCWHVIADVFSSYYLLQTWLKMHFLYTGFQTHFAHKSLYGFGVSKCDKIHYFFKQCLRNLHFCKTRYFSRNLSISCSIQVPYFDKVKVVHNTVLKVNGLHNLKHFVCTLMGRVPACQYQIHYIWVMRWAISISATHNTYSHLGRHRLVF